MSEILELNRINKEIVILLQEKGIAVPLGTTLNGKYAIRVAITNHRSQREDFKLLVKEILNIADSIRNLP